MASRARIPSGVIDHLIRLPSDNSEARIRKGLLISSGINVMVLVMAYAASTLRQADPSKPPFIQMSFPGDDLPQVRVPVKLPPPKKVVEKPVRKRKPEVRRQRPVRREPPKPVKVARRQPEPAKPQPVKPEPRIANVPEPVRNVARPPQPQQPPTTVASASSATESVRVANSTAVTARVNANRSLAPSPTATPEASVSAPTFSRSAPSLSRNSLASSETVSVAASESVSSATVATRSSAAPTASRSSAEPTVRGVAATVAGVRGGYTSFGGAAAGVGANVASISAPAFVGRRAPAMGSTVLISDKSTVMTAAMDAKGTSNSGLALIQGASGTVASSIAVSRSNVQVAGAGAASVGAGGRSIGTTADARAAGVAAVATVGNSRSPVLGNTNVVGNVRGGVSEAAPGDGTGVGVASAGNNIGDAVAGSTRSAGGGSGPRGQSGVARAGGGGGSSIAAGAGSSGPIAVEARTSAGADEVRKPVAADASKLGERNNAGGAAANRNDDPKPTFQPDVDLSAELRRRRFTGRVLLEVTVDVDGSHTERILVSSGDDDVDNAVRSTFRRWRWEPGYRDGQKVKATRKYEYRIRVND